MCFWKQNDWNGQDMSKFAHIDVLPHIYERKLRFNEYWFFSFWMRTTDFYHFSFEKNRHFYLKKKLSVWGVISRLRKKALNRQQYWWSIILFFYFSSIIWLLAFGFYGRLNSLRFLRAYWLYLPCPTRSILCFILFDCYYIIIADRQGLPKIFPS